jgi:hypothetical protein
LTETVGQMIYGAVEHLAHHLGFVIEKGRALGIAVCFPPNLFPSLALNVPLGISDAIRELKVTVEPADLTVGQSTKTTRDERARIVGETAGAWRGDDERPKKGELEFRDQLP